MKDNRLLSVNFHHEIFPIYKSTRRDIMMEVNYRIKYVTSIRDKDLTNALDIYIHSIDEQSDTSTSEIRAYIQDKYQEERQMFFYILYANNQVVGYAEYGYLPTTKVLFIDYICTNPRNHTYFYNFYHMIFEDIRERLKRKNEYIKYIVTELSLKKDNDDIYIDKDSNYFRQLLTMEEFKILKAPYYQPALNSMNLECSLEFNIAIKPLINGVFTNTNLEKEFYLDLVKDIYYKHYALWYKHFRDSNVVEEHINSLLERINKEFPHSITIDDITLVNCVLFQNGLCKQVNTENITLKKERTKTLKLWLSRIMGLLFSVITFIACCTDFFASGVAIICSFLTIISAIISIIQFMKE